MQLISDQQGTELVDVVRGWLRVVSKPIKTSLAMAIVGCVAGNRVEAVARCPGQK